MRYSLVGFQYAGGYNYYVSPTGSDEAAGTEDAPFATISKLSEVLAAATDGSKTTAYVATGTYNDEHFDITREPTALTTTEVTFGAGSVMDANGTGNAFNVSGSNLRLVINGNGSTIQNTESTTGNGIGTRQGATLIVRDFLIKDCGDGASAHDDSFIELYDCTIQDCGKACVAHVDTSTTYHSNCVFKGDSTMSAGPIDDTSTGASTYDDCSIVLTEAATKRYDVFNATFNRCLLGDLSGNGFNTFNRARDSIFNDCFLDGTIYNLTAGTTSQFNRCYGNPSFQKSGVVSTLKLRNCSFYDSYGSTRWFNWTTSDGSIVDVKDCIFQAPGSTLIFDHGGSAAAASNYAIWTHAYNCFYTPVTYSDYAAQFPTPASTVDADPLTTKTVSLTQSDYGYQTGSPCIGAGEGGGNIGFAQ